MASGFPHINPPASLRPAGMHAILATHQGLITGAARRQYCGNARHKGICKLALPVQDMRAGSGPAAGPATGAAPAKTPFAAEAGAGNSGGGAAPAAAEATMASSGAAEEDAADDAETEVTSVVATSALRSDSDDAGGMQLLACTALCFISRCQYCPFMLAVEKAYFMHAEHPTVPACRYGVMPMGHSSHL